MNQTHVSTADRHNATKIQTVTGEVLQFQMCSAFSPNHLRSQRFIILCGYHCFGKSSNADRWIKRSQKGSYIRTSELNLSKHCPNVHLIHQLNRNSLTMKCYLRRLICFALFSIYVKHTPKVNRTSNGGHEIVLSQLMNVVTRCSKKVLLIQCLKFRHNGYKRGNLNQSKSIINLQRAFNTLLQDFDKEQAF